MRTLPDESEMRRAVVNRDAGYDGVFFLAVKTTGIFCRPSCPARKPKPTNTEYYSNVQSALLAGYRPCKRCRPLERNGAAPAWVTKLLRHVESAPTQRLHDADLRALSIVPARARRYFAKHYGMTFHAFHRSRRMGMALAEVRHGSGVTSAGLRHGYESDSGFREAFQKIFGQSPTRAAQKDTLLASWLSTPLGPMLAAANDDGLCMLEFVDRRGLETQIETLRQRAKVPVVPGTHEFLRQTARELESYFAGSIREFSVPLCIRGTPFQTAVWHELLKIPYGQTRSYDDLARAIGRPTARRPVGRANGDNRIAIMIPCHRVIGADGQLTGYGGGLWRKKFLLDLESGQRTM